MIARGISEKEVDECVRCGSKYTQEPDKIVSEHQYFAVVYKKRGDDVVIITVKPRW